MSPGRQLGDSHKLCGTQNRIYRSQSIIAKGPVDLAYVEVHTTHGGSMLRSIFLAVVSEYQLPPCLAIIFFILRRTRLATWRQAPSVTLSHALFVAALMAAKSDPSSGDTPVGTQGAENSAGGPDRPSGWLQRTASPRYSSTQCANPANPKSLIFCLRGSR